MIAPRTTRTLGHIIGYEGMPDRPQDKSGIPAMAAAATRMIWRRL